MKNIQKSAKRGFTLIELLVVVLIIGILAAIALPQYQIAVGKSRVAEAMSKINTAKDAVERYYLVHGKYPDGILYNPQTFSDMMDISLPQLKSNETFVYYPNVYISYGFNTGGGEVNISQILDRAEDHWKRGIQCWTNDTSITNSIPQKICISVCGHDHIVRLWGSPEVGCVIGVPEYNGFSAE